MQRASGYIRDVVSRIFIIGVSIQIVLGLFWMFCSFNDLPTFPYTKEYIGISTSLLCDEYTGILYPFLLMLVRAIGSAIGVPYAMIMYLLQICMAILASYCFLDELDVIGIFGRGWKIWGSLAMLTYAYGMQCHMAILPDSLAYSCFLLALTFLFKTGKDVADFEKGSHESKRKMIRDMLCLCLFWLMASLMLPEYLYFGLVPVAALLLYLVLKKRWKMLLYASLLIVAFLGMMVGILRATQVEGSMGNVHRSPEAAWFRRTAWSSLDAYYPDWPQEVKDAVTEEEFTLARNFPENMRKILQPKIETVIGEEAARKWFGEFATATFKRNYRQILEEVAEDVTGLILAPVVSKMRLEGKGYASFCARNYEIMRQYHPVITHKYLEYSAWWYLWGVLLLLITAFTEGYRVARAMVTEKKAIVCAGSALAMILWYVFQDAGLWDPKKAIFVGGLWVVLMIGGALDHRRQKDRFRK